MTPLERAARDEVTAFLDAQDRHVHGHMPVATTHNPDGTVRTLEREHLRLVLAALDRHEQVAESVQETARQVAEHAGRFGPVPERLEITYQADDHRGGCEECSCCVASGCHTGPGSTCPVERLGDSVCPCTGD